jgi:hypothetical protein
MSFLSEHYEHLLNKEIFLGKLAKYFLVMSEVRALELYKIRNPNAKDVNRNKMTAYKRVGSSVESGVPTKK